MQTHGILRSPRVKQNHEILGTPPPKGQMFRESRTKHGGARIILKPEPRPILVA